jgi:hypothetical protein
MRYGFVLGLLLAAASPTFANSSKVQLPETGLMTAQSFSCQPRKTCGKIRSCDEATWYLYNCNWGSRLDGDSDGAPCETLCGSNN